MTLAIASIETFIVTLDRETPYLGPLGEGESINPRGYILRQGNGTIYPVVDRSVVVRVTAADGTVGWGETYGICAPRATCEIINDLLAPVAIGRDALDPEALWDVLYDLMRVRGCFGGFYVDAIAAIDIAVWDIAARAAGKPLSAMLAPRLGGTLRETVPGYLSGLPASDLAGKVALAREWQARGIDSFKFAAVVSNAGIIEELAALRSALGPEAEIMVDLHWKFDATGALALIEQLAPYRPRFVEAPVKPERVDALAAVCRESTVPVAAGEEWRTEHEARLRLGTCALSLIQPEMGHTGVTQFCRIARLAAEHGVPLAPHATIGTGIFLAASLLASAAVPQFWKHEWQHSVFERNLALLDTDMAFDAAAYRLPSGAGLGVVPNARFWQHAVRVD